MATRYVGAVFARKIFFFENLLFLKVMGARAFFLGLHSTMRDGVAVVQPS